MFLLFLVFARLHLNITLRGKLSLMDICLVSVLEFCSWNFVLGINWPMYAFTNLLFPVLPNLWAAQVVYGEHQRGVLAEEMSWEDSMCGS